MSGEERCPFREDYIDCQKNMGDMCAWYDNGDKVCHIVKISRNLEKLCNAGINLADLNNRANQLNPNNEKYKLPKRASTEPVYE